MSKKHARIAELVAHCRRVDLDSRYEGYFECFNRRLFFEAHDVLEDLWLQDKQSPQYSFYKGLIQLAGAFVHLQKGRLRPAQALLGLARANLLKYPAKHEGLNLEEVLRVIDFWSALLGRFGYEINPLTFREPPVLALSVPSASE